VSSVFFDQLYPYFQRSLENLLPEVPQRIAVAFSGGPDSLALLRLTQKWSLRYPVQVIALMVDHGFRAESKILLQEAAERIKPTSFDILTWHYPIVCQAKARMARYALLCEACHRLQIPVLLLGHHLDDALETFWMRKKLSSSDFGLAGMTAVREVWGIQCLRPLLFASKQDLLLCLEKGDSYIQDPSNHHPQFQRTHARAAIQESSAKEKKLLIRELIRLNQSRAWQEKEWSLRHPCAYHHGLGYVVGCIQSTKIAGLETLSALIWHWMKAVSFQKTPPAQQALQQFAVRIQNNPLTFQTFGGCLWKVEKEKLYILKESGRGMAAVCGFKQGRFLEDNSGKVLYQAKTSFPFLLSPYSGGFDGTDFLITSKKIEGIARQTWSSQDNVKLVRPSSFYPDFVAFDLLY
jgi:tRNA(Ile)-lysidine synthase